MVYDVIVLGGGSSGYTAATAAARTGAKTLLIERYGFLGGTLAGAMVMPMMTFHSPREQVVKGLAQEIVDRLIAIGGSPGHIPDTSGFVATVTPFDTEALKLVALDLVQEAGVDLLLHAWGVEAEVSQGLVRAIKVQTKGGVRRFTARQFIDASGDADLVAFAGGDFELGRPGDRLMQPATLKFKVAGVDTAAIKAYAKQRPDQFRLGPGGLKALLDEPLISICGFFDLLAEARANGELDLQRDQVLFFNTPHPDEVVVNMSRVGRIDGTNPDDLTRAEIQSRRQVAQLMKFLKEKVPGFADSRLVSTGVWVGLRETRRIVGEYTLTGEDVLAARKFDDQIARSAYPIDIHSPDGDSVETAHTRDEEAYGIPYRCLLPRDLDNVLAVGRTISTTHEAHSATRLSPTCMAMGEAAGIAAAIACTLGKSPKEIPIGRLQDALIAAGADIGQRQT